MPILWTEDMRIGHPIVDADHMQLIEIINLALIVVSERDLGQADNILYSLLNYVAGHFKREEAILAEIGYPALEAHKSKHDSFGNYTKRMAIALHDKKPDLEKLELIGQLTDHLKTWLVQHILVEDVEMIPYLTKAGYRREWGPQGT